MICIGREIQCLPYTGFFFYKSEVSLSFALLVKLTQPLGFKYLVRKDCHRYQIEEEKKEKKKEETEWEEK